MQAEHANLVVYTSGSWQEVRLVHTITEERRIECNSMQQSQSSPWDDWDLMRHDATWDMSLCEEKLRSLLHVLGYTEDTAEGTISQVRGWTDATFCAPRLASCLLNKDQRHPKAFQELRWIYTYLQLLVHTVHPSCIYL